MDAVSGRNVGGNIGALQLGGLEKGSPRGAPTSTTRGLPPKGGDRRPDDLVVELVQARSGMEHDAGDVALAELVA